MTNPLHQLFVTFGTPIINPPICYQQLAYSSHSDAHTLLQQKWLFVKMNYNISSLINASNINSNLFQLAKLIKAFHLGIIEKPIHNRIHKRSWNLTAYLGTRNCCYLCRINSKIGKHMSTWWINLKDSQLNATYCWVMKRVGGVGKACGACNIIYCDVTLLFMNK